MANFTLKWNKDDPSNAIMLTFDVKWLEPLLAGNVSYVFRKMGPNRFVPDLIYAYFSQPISAVAAKCPVISWESLSIDEALALASQGSISTHELHSYAKDYKELIVIGIGKPQEAKTRIEMQFMRKEFGFWPSSTFMPLSATGCKTLNALAKFAKPK